MQDKKPSGTGDNNENERNEYRLARRNEELERLLSILDNSNVVLAIQALHIFNDATSGLNNNNNNNNRCNNDHENSHKMDVDKK